MPVLGRGEAIGAWWYWGTFENAAEHLGIGVPTFRRVMDREPIRDFEQDKINAAWRTLSPDARYSVKYGGEFVRAMSPEQAALMKRGDPNRDIPPFKGKKFAKATRRFIHDRTKIPRGVGDYFDEFYEGELR